MIRFIPQYCVKALETKAHCNTRTEKNQVKSFLYSHFDKYRFGNYKMAKRPTGMSQRRRIVCNLCQI